MFPTWEPSEEFYLVCAAENGVVRENGSCLCDKHRILSNLSCTGDRNERTTSIFASSIYFPKWNSQFHSVLFAENTQCVLTNTMNNCFNAHTESGMPCATFSVPCLVLDKQPLTAIHLGCFLCKHLCLPDKCYRVCKRIALVVNICKSCCCCAASRTFCRFFSEQRGLSTRECCGFVALRT